MWLQGGRLLDFMLVLWHRRTKQEPAPDRRITFHKGAAVGIEGPKWK